MNQNRQNMSPMPAGWFERRGGLLFSFFFHCLLFFILFIKIVPAPQASKPPAAITLRLIMPKPQSVQKEILPTEARATHVKESELKTETDPSEIPEPTPQIPRIKKTPKTDPYKKALVEIRKNLSQEERSVDRSITMLRGQIEKRASHKKRAIEDFDSLGADEGTVRILEIGDVPEQVAASVLKKYKIRITHKFITGEKGLRFLNKAQVEDKTFHSQAGAGFYEVFELPIGAMKKLTFLERSELIKRGLDPNNTQVLKVIFGIVEKDGMYDLGVTHFSYRELD